MEKKKSNLILFLSMAILCCCTVPAITTPTTTPFLCDASKEDMCSSLYRLRNQTLSSPSTAGRCSVSNDCTRLSCSLTVSYSGFNVPLSLTTTLHPCSVPYKVHLAVSSSLLGEIVNDHFTESRTITISVFGTSADVIVSLTQHCYGVTISNAVLIGGSRLDFISPANIYMFCDRSTSITMATSPMLSVPVTTAYNPTTTTPTTTPITTPTTTPLLCDASKEDMCSSLFSLRSQTLSSPGTTGRCNVSGDCTTLSCSLTVSYSGFNVPLSLRTTLHPCSVPYKVHLAVSSPLLGEIVDEDFTGSRTITIRVLGTNADVIVSLTEHCYGVTISNAVLIGGSRLDFISPANISMFCDRSSSITMATSTTPPLPMTTTLISTATTPSTMPAPSPTPTTYPVACGPKFNITPSVTFDAVNRALSISHYPPEGSECKCVFRKMEKRKRKKPCLPRDTMSGIRLRKNEKGRLVITCKIDDCSYKQSVQVKNK